MVTITRTYETFAIQWDNGSRWAGYDTEARALAQIGSSAQRGKVGTLERRTFDVTFDSAHAHLYQPGIAEVIA